MQHIAFLLPADASTPYGGYKVVFEYANRADRRRTQSNDRLSGILLVLAQKHSQKIPQYPALPDRTPTTGLHRELVPPRSRHRGEVGLEPERMFRTESGHLCRYGMLDGRIFEALPERIPSKQVLPDPGIRGLVAAYGKTGSAIVPLPDAKDRHLRMAPADRLRNGGGEIAN